MKTFKINKKVTVTSDEKDSFNFLLRRSKARQPSRPRDVDGCMTWKGEILPWTAAERILEKL